ncbi:hypothetical protein D3C80_1463770 [compost metagenome]
MFEVGSDDIDRTGISVRLQIRFHGRQPGTQEHVHVLTLGQGLEGKRNANQRRFGLVAEALQQCGRNGGGGLDIRPARIGHSHQATLGRFSTEGIH